MQKIDGGKYENKSVLFYLRMFLISMFLLLLRALFSFPPLCACPRISRPRLGDKIAHGYKFRVVPCGVFGADFSPALTALLVSRGPSGPKLRGDILGVHDSPRCPPERMVSRMDPQSKAFSCFLAILVVAIGSFFAPARPSPLAPAPLLGSNELVLGGSAMAPALVPESTVSRGPGRESTRHWSWIPRPGDPPSRHPCVSKGAEKIPGSQGLRGSFFWLDTDAMGSHSSIPPGCAMGEIA